MELNPAMEIGIVVPCFNEESRLDIAYWTKLINFFSYVHWHFIDDGSSDNTFTLLNSIYPHCNMSVNKNLRNLGKAESIRIGMKYFIDEFPCLKYVGYVDGDGAFEFDDFKNLFTHSLETSNIYEVILASRVKLAGSKITRSTLRHYLGRIVTTAVTYGWGDSPYDTQCGFKLFLLNSNLSKSLEPQMSSRWFVDIELFARLTRVKNSKLSLKEIPLQNWKEIPNSKLRIANLKLIKEIFIARKMVIKYLVKT